MSGQNDEGIKKYKFEGKITSENVKNFVNSWKDGKLLPYWKVEETRDDSPFIKRLNSAIYQEIVMNNQTDVMVLYVKSGC